MSHADPGPLAAYNSLQDKHLAGYFSNARMKKHLKKSGLVTRKGKIIDEKTYRLNMAKKEHRKHVRDLLATAIVHKTLDLERIRQYEIRKKLDEVYKVELVRRVKTKEPELKEGRNRKGDEDILPLLSPRERTAQQMHKAQHRERPATAPAAFAERGEEEETHLKPSEIYYDDETQKIYYRVDSSPLHMNGYLKDETEELGPSPYTRAYPATYPAPAPPPSGTLRRTRTQSTPRKGVRLQRFHYLARTEPAVARRVQLQSMAEVTMKFLGPSLVLTNSMFPEDRLSEVMVLQQHCGGSTLCVFRELLPPNTIFTFISRRHRGAPFGLTFYIDGMQDIRLSSCCEYKHKPGHILGGKNGHFQFVVVEGAAPCYRCQIASAHKHSKHKHKNTEGSGDGEDDDRSKAFMTETANEQEEGEQGETFDVIITKIKSAGGEDGHEEIDGGEMVDHSTQTPRDEIAIKQEQLDVDGENTAGSADSVPDDLSAEAEESRADKYDDEEFEEGAEKDKESESEAKEETEGDEDKQEDDYNEDFESDEEKERDKSDDEDGKESEEEEDPEDDIQDETDDKEKSDTGEEEQAEEVEDETDKEKQDNAGRPTSATDSEGRQSKNVSFDEDVTVIEDEQEEVENDEEENPEDVPEEVAEQNDREDPGVDTAEQESEDVPEKVPLESSRQGQDDSTYPEEEHKQDDNQERDDTVRSPEPSDSSSSSSSSSSGSESSDSDDESKKARRSKKKKKGKEKSRPGQDPGSDPDLVSSGQLPEQALKAVGVQPGTKHDGSIQSLLGGKEDVELVGVALTKEQFEEVAKIVDSRDDLGTVILRNTSADDSVLETLAASLRNAPTLKMLNLSVNRIGPEGAKRLADVIRQNKSLRMLLLHGNPLTDEGVGIIIDAIVETTDTSIMNLDLGDCGLTEDGAKHIANLIEHNSTVSVLTISGNTIQLEGWQNISKALSTNSTLETLSLDFNKIGDEEAISIAEGIQGCKSLRSVDLEGNKIGDEGGRKLFDAVKANRSIVDLTLLPINQISKEIVDEVKDFLKEREKGNEPEEAGGGEEQHEAEFSTLQLQQDSGEQGLVTKGGSTETSHEETVNEYPSTQEDSEGGQEQKENDGVIKDVEQGEEPPDIVQADQGREEKNKEADDREQPSGDDQQSEKENSTAEENAAPAEGAGQLPDAEHPEHQDVAPAKDDQDGNEPQQDPQSDSQHDRQQDPQLDPQQDPQTDPQPDPQLEPHQDTKSDPQLDPQQDPQLIPQQDPHQDPQSDPQPDPQQNPLSLSELAHSLALSEHPEHQDVAPAMDDQDGNEPQQDPQSDSQHDPQKDPQSDPQQDPQPDPQLEPHQDTNSDPQLDPQQDPQLIPQQDLHQDPQSDPQLDIQDPQMVPQQDPQQSENGEAQDSPRREQPQILEDPGESTGQESLGRDKEDEAPQDPALSVHLGVNDDEETSKRVPSTEREGNDNKQEGVDNETEDKQLAGAFSPSEDAQKNSSDAAS